MSAWLLLTVLAIVSRAVFSIATKIISSQVKVSSITQAFLLTAFASVLSFLVSPLIGGITFVGISNIWMVVIIMVLSQAMGNIVFFKGLEKLDAGTAQIAFSSILLWTVLFSSVFLKTHFSLQQGIGIVLLFFAILFAQYRNDIKRWNGYVGYIMASAALFAIFQIMSAELAKTLTVGTYLLLAYLGSTIIIGFLCSGIIKRDLKILKKNLSRVGAYCLFSSGTSLLHIVLAYFAYQAAPDPGIVVILLTSQVVLSVIFGIIFLKEKEYMGRKLLAGGIALIAAILIKS